MVQYVFGYGSLINMAANAVELDDALAKPVWPVSVTGLKRSLNVKTSLPLPTDDLLVFGVRRQQSICNGIIFPVTKEELARLKQREGRYKAKQLDWSSVHWSTYQQTDPQTRGLLWCFFPKTAAIASRHELRRLRPRPGYLQLCRDGCRRFGAQFLKDFNRQTTTTTTTTTTTAVTKKARLTGQKARRLARKKAVATKKI